VAGKLALFLMPHFICVSTVHKLGENKQWGIFALNPRAYGEQKASPPQMKEECLVKKNPGPAALFYSWWQVTH